MAQRSSVDFRGADIPRWAGPEFDDRSELGNRRLPSPLRLPSVRVVKRTSPHRLVDLVLRQPNSFRAVLSLRSLF